MKRLELKQRKKLSEFGIKKEIKQAKVEAEQKNQELLKIEQEKKRQKELELANKWKQHK